MISVSQEFIDAAIAPEQDARGALMITDGSGKVFSLLRDNIQTFSVTRSASDGETVTVGATQSSKLQATVLSSYVTGSFLPESLNGLCVIPLVGFHTSDGYDRWLALGRFWIDDSETKVDDLFTTFTAYDSLNAGILNESATVSKSGNVYTCTATEDSTIEFEYNLSGTGTSPYANADAMIDELTLQDGTLFLSDPHGFITDQQPYVLLNEDGQTFKGILQRIAISSGGNVISRAYDGEIVNANLSPYPSLSGYTNTFDSSTGRWTVNGLTGTFSGSTLTVTPDNSQLRDDTLYLFSSYGIIESSDAGGLACIRPTGNPLYIGTTYTATVNASASRVTLNGVTGSFASDTLTLDYERALTSGNRLYVLKASNAITPSSYGVGALTFDNTGKTVYNKVTAVIDDFTYVYDEGSYTAGFTFDAGFFDSESSFDSVAARILNDGHLAYEGFSLEAYGLVFIEPYDTLFVKDIRNRLHLLMPVSTAITYDGGLTISMGVSASNEMVAVTTG